MDYKRTTKKYAIITFFCFGFIISVCLHLFAMFHGPYSGELNGFLAFLLVALWVASFIVGGFHVRHTGEKSFTVFVGNGYLFAVMIGLYLYMMGNVIFYSSPEHNFISFNEIASVEQQKVITSVFMMLFYIPMPMVFKAIYH